MTYRVILQPRAERDIRHVARWKLERGKSPESARRWVRSLRAKFDTLKASPHRCPIDPDSDAYGAEVRVLLHGKRQGKCRILFTIRGDEVRVLAVRHAAQESLIEEPDLDEGA